MPISSSHETVSRIKVVDAKRFAVAVLRAHDSLEDRAIGQKGRVLAECQPCLPKPARSVDLEQIKRIGRRLELLDLGLLLLQGQTGVPSATLDL